MTGDRISADPSIRIDQMKSNIGRDCRERWGASAGCPLADDAHNRNVIRMSQLVLKYQYDASFLASRQKGDDFGRLSLSVSTSRFAGNGAFWVQWQDVKEFGEALATFPITSPVVVQWGYDMQEGNDLILKVEIAPADKRGTLIVRFEIADEFETDERVRGSFMTHYPELDAFRVAIGKMMKCEAEEAVLAGS
jgi:hypothetical protein